MPNRLSGEKSPYLLQHANNPVNWYPWGAEAFQRAQEEDKPIFLSIGYATCHWCHVMEVESFEDEEVAELLNTYFVSIKVDREERPDVDHIYMTVCQALRGSGGWPLSIFMTPDKKPFFGGSYFPKTSRFGITGFTDILLQLANLWQNDRPKITQASQQITAAIQPRQVLPHGDAFRVDTLEKGFQQLKSMFDERWGGFGQAPKFPTPHHLTFLLRWYQRSRDVKALEIVEKTLTSMRMGGIFDHVGSGFHRYSVDERWLVPHFEKMLYDQAMLAMAYVEACQVTGNEGYARVAREIYHYVLRDMTAGEGGFFSAEDADSEGEEGLFYVWTSEEVTAVLGEEVGNLYCRCCDITAEGNFEHHRSIPHTPGPLSDRAKELGVSTRDLERVLKEANEKLFEKRKQRVHPLKDDKILTAWNGLMIAAFAKGYQVLGDDAYKAAAMRAADFVLQSLRKADGRLYRRFRHGEIAHPGYADDYAMLIWGLIELYEATFAVRYLVSAVDLQQQMLDLFWDDQAGGVFFTAHDGEPLIVRDKEIYDGAVPSSNSLTCLNLLRLARMTGNAGWEEKADRIFQAFHGLVADYPAAYTQFLQAVDVALGPSKEIVIAGSSHDPVCQEMMELVRSRFTPNGIVLFRDMDQDGESLRQMAGFVDDHVAVDGKAAVYVCENYACHRPVTDIKELKQILGG